jgi:iron complex outermembrane recepter protein
MRKHIFIVSAMALAMQANAQTDTVKVLDEVILTGIRAKINAPVTQYNIATKQIKQLYYGADLPMVLRQAPSIHAYSDNGTGVGYSFFRLRGLDQTRINVTINGVPINDPENQGTFFNNIADMASSAQSIQVQRGVGTSTNGAAAFGGSVNIQTRNLTETPDAEINLGAGSYNLRRLTAEVQTGKIANKYAFYARLSNIASGGFRERSGSEINSYLFSGAKYGKRSIWRLNTWGGDAQSQLAYVGVSQQILDTNRRYNPLEQDERDRFRQHFFQLQYQYQVSAKSGINASTYYVRGVAPQFQVYFAASPFFPYSFYNMPQPIIGTDTITQTDAMVSYRLDQHFFGGFVNYYFYTNKLEFDAGVHANSFAADHFMETQWIQVVPQGILPNHRAYFNTGYKQEASAFAKINYAVAPKVKLFADVQIRSAFFRYAAQTMQYALPPFSVEPMQWTFVNPKAGASYQLKENVLLYAMLGQSNREPTRFDYFQDDYATRNVKQTDVKPERVNNAELGVRFNQHKFMVQTNAYIMQFSNAIVNTGEINAFGYPITTNVPNSIKGGIELDGVWKVLPELWLTYAAVLSYNRIESITQFYTDSIGQSVGIVFNNSTPALTPSVIINQGIKWMPLDWFTVDINARHVSRQFVDNSSTMVASVPDYTVADIRLALALKKWLKTDATIAVHVNNILDTEYNSWGSVAVFSNTATYDPFGRPQGTVTPLFFAAAPRNIAATLQVKF